MTQDEPTSEQFYLHISDDMMDHQHVDVGFVPQWSNGSHPISAQDESMPTVGDRSGSAVSPTT